MKKFILYILLLVSTAAVSQDMQFSQYYGSPLYLNPAFTGTAPDHRLTLTHRNQWPQIGNGFVSYAFSYDYNMSDLRSGFGILVSTDKAGSAGLRSTHAAFNYAYKVKLSSNWMFTPGLYFAYNRRHLDYSKLVFGDQLEFDDRGEVITRDLEILNNLTDVQYFDAGVGGLIYNRKFWWGFSAHHLNRPNQSMLGEESRWPVKYSFHGGVQIPLYHGLKKRSRVSSIAPSFNYKKQGEFDQLDVGLHFLYDPIMLGLWYRGVPIQQNINDRVSQDAIVIIMGVKLKDMEIGYSYDFTTSELSSVSGGAHEISIKYEFSTVGRNKVKRKDKFIPCPTFIQH
ncbi:MAG: PorP/SprF family type IX secretion system membrane protein [Candidatus Cyclobacteriaceae bacterium M2_1C_046]